MTHLTHPKLILMGLNPGVLHSVSFAKYAAAFFNISRSCFKRAFSFLNCFTSSSRLFLLGPVELTFDFPGNFFTQPCKVFSLIPKSFAVCLIDCSELRASSADDSLNSKL